MSMISFLRKLKNKLEEIAHYSNFDRPIFIISPPRSGSTFLFECLTKFDNLYYLNHEADPVWWSNFPYEKMKNPSDYLGTEQISHDNIRNIRRQIYRSAVFTYLSQHQNQSKFPYYFGIKSIRYLDKTIANCFHLEFLDRAFPDANYVFLIRDPRANISSMIEGWPYIERFGKPQLTPIVRSLNGATIEHWTYPAPPGWQDIVTKPLEQICAWSWMQHIEYTLDFFDKHSKRVTLVRYEELTKNTLATVSHLANELGLNLSEIVKEYATNPAPSRTTVSKPDSKKWRVKNYDKIISILPMIEKTAKKVGFNVFSKAEAS